MSFRRRRESSDFNMFWMPDQVRHDELGTFCETIIIGIWNFDIIRVLSIVIWDFSAISGKVNCFYLHQLELTLTFPCIIADKGFSFFLSMV
jgi:hypothetical protein